MSKMPDSSVAYFTQRHKYPQYVVELAQEVQELRAEVERLTAEKEVERQIADQLAGALRWFHQGDCVWCNTPTIGRNQDGEPLCGDYDCQKDDYSQRLRKEKQK